MYARPVRAGDHRCLTGGSQDVAIAQTANRDESDEEIRPVAGDVLSGMNRRTAGLRLLISLVRSRWWGLPLEQVNFNALEWHPWQR